MKTPKKLKPNRMNTSATRLVFISYSRYDKEFVDSAVELLRAGGVAIFLDRTDIDYGGKWEPTIDVAINVCERILVFWSASAAKSDWVRREYLRSIELGKKVIPIVLDDTELAPQLATYQSNNKLQEMFTTTCSKARHGRNALSENSARAWFDSRLAPGSDKKERSNIISSYLTFWWQLAKLNPFLRAGSGIVFHNNPPSTERESSKGDYFRFFSPTIRIDEKSTYHSKQPELSVQNDQYVELLRKHGKEIVDAIFE